MSTQFGRVSSPPECFMEQVYAIFDDSDEVKDYKIQKDAEDPIAFATSGVRLGPKVDACVFYYKGKTFLLNYCVFYKGKTFLLICVNDAILCGRAQRSSMILSPLSRAMGSMLLTKGKLMITLESRLLGLPRTSSNSGNPT
jgi:hypothetical protein